MSGNLIDNTVKQYQQQVSQQPISQQPYVGYPVNSTGKQTVDKTPQSDSFENQEKKDNKKPLLILGSWFGLNKLMDLFNKNCSNENYEKTIMGRLGTFGDKVSDKYKDNKILTSIKAGGSTFKTFIKNYINKKPLLSAMFNTPTKPENSFVKGFMETQQHADLSEAARTIEGYLGEMPKTLKEAGATKAEIQALKAKYGKGTFGGVKNLRKALQELQFNRIGAPANFIDTLAPDKIAETLKEMKIKHLGLDPSTYETVLKNPTKYEKVITEACKRGGKNAKAFFGRNSWLPFVGLFTKRSTNLSMSYNKLISGTKHVSKLGKALAKAPKLFMRGLTFGGGKINSLFVAFGLGTALYNALKAPKDQKVGTAVAGGVDAVSWIVSMPLAIKLMHGINGIQYTGMSKMQVGRYRVAYRNFEKMAKSGAFADKAAYDAAWQSVQNLKNVAGTQSKFVKAMKKVGSFLSIGLETKPAYKEVTKGLKGSAKMSAIGRNLKRMLPSLGKNAVGYPLRFAIYALAISPLVEKLISSCTSAIFGKPYEPEEEAEKEAKEKVAENPSQNIQPIQPKQTQPSNSQHVEQQPVVKTVSINDLPDDNLIKRELSGDHVINQPEERYIPSEKCEIEGIVSPYDNEDRTYIPSDSAPTIKSNQEADRSKVDVAIAKASKAEENAMNVLNGIY